MTFVVVKRVTYEPIASKSDFAYANALNQSYKIEKRMRVNKCACDLNAKVQK